MNLLEKAGIRIDHWISHNENHLKEYEAFADELDAAGKSESARHVRKTAALTAEGNQCLRQATLTLGPLEQEESHV